jgi:hypothetical protein
MVVFCDRLKFCSTAALNCRTGQNKGRYRKKGALTPTCLVGRIGKGLIWHIFDIIKSLKPHNCMYLNLTLSTWQMIMKKTRICPIIGLCFMSNSLVISCNTSIYWEHWVASRRLKGPLDGKKNAQKFIGFDCNLFKVKGVSREKPSSCNSLHAMSFFFLYPFFGIVMFFKATLLKTILNILNFCDSQTFKWNKWLFLHWEVDIR